MKKSLYGVSILALLILLGGCKSSQDDIKNNIENMMAKPVTIPYKYRKHPFHMRRRLRRTRQDHREAHRPRRHGLRRGDPVQGREGHGCAASADRAP